MNCANIWPRWWTVRGRWAGSSKPTRRPMSAAAGLARVVLDVRKRTLQPVVAGNVEHGSIVHTDELRSYGGGLNKAGYAHKTVNHGTGEYVDGNCHVNSLEGFWVRLKLSILRTHVHVSRQHLQKYVKEFEYRYNLRKTPHLMFGALLARLAQTIEANILSKRFQLPLLRCSLAKRSNFPDFRGSPRLR